MTRMYFQYHHRCTDVTDVCTVFPAHRCVGKKIAFTFVIIFILQNKAFTQFEINLKISPIISFTFANPNDDLYLPPTPINIGFTAPGASELSGQEGKTRSSTLFGASVLIELGYSFKLEDSGVLKSFSVLADIGYYHQGFGVDWNRIVPEGLISRDIFRFHTLNLGSIFNFYITPNINFLPFSIGIGYGIRIPLAGIREETNPITLNTVKVSKLSYNNIKTLFVNDYILYGKLSFDIYCYIRENFALTYGLFLSYSYGMQYYNQNSFYADLNDEKRGFNSLEIGISAGFYFGKQNPRPKKEAL